MQQLTTGTLLQGGKYKIEENIGQGGFGITYRACQPLMLGRKVCIKEFCLKQHFSRDSTTSAITYPNDTARKDAEMFQQKFIKEAQTLYSMHHPNIMEIYDIFEENNTAYYVMEYIEGESLKDMLERRGCIPEAEAIGYIRKVAEALKYIHSRNINHFDVKPANILVRSSDKEIILIDFGTAKHYDSKTGNATTMTSGLLSPGYAPIEQYQQGGVSVFTPETDIYALGATLYKLLTGITPPEPTEIISNGIPELPSALSKSTKDLIKWAMQLNKANRPHSCNEFLKTLSSNTEEGVRYCIACEKDAKDTTISINSKGDRSTNNPVNDIEETKLIKQDVVIPKEGNKIIATSSNMDTNNDLAHFITKHRRLKIILSVLVAWGIIGYVHYIFFIPNVHESEFSNYESERYIDLGVSKYWSNANLQDDFFHISKSNWYFNTDNHISYPDKKDIEELINKCDWKLVKINDVIGYKVTGSTGKTIFLPVEGVRDIEDIDKLGAYSYYLAIFYGINFVKPTIYHCYFYNHTKNNRHGVFIRKVKVVSP